MGLLALRTTRLSANGTRGLATLIASTVGGAGSTNRLYKYIANLEKKGDVSPQGFFFNYLGGRRDRVVYYNNLYNNSGY